MFVEDGCSVLVVVDMIFNGENAVDVVDVVDFVVSDKVAGLVGEEIKVEDTGDAL